MKLRHLWISASMLACVASGAPRAFADDPGPTGAPPADAKAMVEAKKVADALKIEKKDDDQSATVSVGGMQTTGNSRSRAGTASAAYDLRRSEHAFGASLLGNYSEGRPPGASSSVLSAENLQGRVRYEYYFNERLSVFGMVTGRHDRFQGIDFRLNLDPGLKLILFKNDMHAVWVEAGYDYQHDIRRDEARIVLDDNKQPVVENGQIKILDKTSSEHSSRLFAGYKVEFNKEVTGSFGLEYLQGFRDADTGGGKRSRLNFEALIAAKLFAGLSLGAGFTARYDNQPLPGKDDLDTTTQATLIYSFAEEKPKPVEPPSPPSEPPPTPPAAAPAPSTGAPAAPAPETPAPATP